jgi:hypothetical protein
VDLSEFNEHEFAYVGCSCLDLEFGFLSLALLRLALAILIFLDVFNTFLTDNSRTAFADFQSYGNFSA